MGPTDSLASGIEVRRLDLSQTSNLLRFLRGTDDALVYYTPQYAGLLADLLGCDAEHWVAWRGHQIVGTLPMLRAEGPWGQVVNSLPFFGSHGGVLAQDPDAFSALVARYNSLAGEPNVLSATWISHPMRPSYQDVVHHTLADERISQITELSDGSSASGSLLARLDGSARRNIRKAQLGGVTVKEDHAALDFLEAAHVEGMRQIGGRAKPHAFFEKLPQHLNAGEDFRLWIAEHAGEPVAALLLLYFNRVVEYFVPATVEAARPLQPMALILWTAMQDALQRGFRVWNWGGTWLTQDGVWRFKKKWAAVERRYRYFVQLNDTSISDRTPEELSAAYPWFYVVPFHALKASR